MPLKGHQGSNVKVANDAFCFHYLSMNGDAISTDVPFTAHSFDTSFLLRVSNEQFPTSIRAGLSCVVQNDQARGDGCNLLPPIKFRGEERSRELSVLSLASLPSSDNFFHSIRIFLPTAHPTCSCTHVYDSRARCVIPGIDRLLLDRSGAGSMLFLPFARATFPFIFCSLRLRRY